MVVINFHHIQAVSSVIDQEVLVGHHESPHLHGSLASGEWLQTSKDAHQGKTKEKSSKCTGSKKSEPTTKQTKIPQAIYVRENECDEWSVSTLGVDSSLRKMRIAVSTPILKGGF